MVGWAERVWGYGTKHYKPFVKTWQYRLRFFKYFLGLEVKKKKEKKISLNYHSIITKPTLLIASESHLI